MKTKKTAVYVFFLTCLLLAAAPVFSQDLNRDTEIDKKVKKFLQDKKNSWKEDNVYGVDGQQLYDLIIENNCTKALEVGTSTGRSGIWIAWALSKTGGKLITVEIDKERYKEAVNNFKEAGVSEFIDARLADAHELVPELEGPFDFVFIDADKNWYTKYAKAIIPKLEKGGSLTAHNIGRFRGGINGYEKYDYVKSYLDYVRNLTFMETTVFSRGGGIAVSFKKE